MSSTLGFHKFWLYSICQLFSLKYSIHSISPGWWQNSSVTSALSHPKSPFSMVFISRSFWVKPQQPTPQTKQTICNLHPSPYLKLIKNRSSCSCSEADAGRKGARWKFLKSQHKDLNDHHYHGLQTSPIEDFSSVWVFKCVLKRPSREDAKSHW